MKYSLRWMAMVLVLAMTACGPEEPIRIGFIGGLSGRGADLGESGRNGVMLAIEQYQARERRIELLVRDDRQDPDAARLAMRELIAAGARRRCSSAAALSKVST